MRRPGPIHLVLSLVLAAWLPWCLCDRVAMGCCDRAEVEPAAEESCSGSCCASHPTTDDDRSPPDDGCQPFGECGAGCCVTKGPVASSIPEIPVDSIGSPIPPTNLTGPDELRPADPPVRAIAAPGTIAPRPGPGVRADSARRLLAAICVRTT